MNASEVVKMELERKAGRFEDVYGELAAGVDDYEQMHSDLVNLVSHVDNQCELSHVILAMGHINSAMWECTLKLRRRAGENI